MTMHNPWENPLDPTATAAVLRQAFAGADGILVAFIFGSLAKGDYRAESDVDVMVIGPIAGIDISRRTSRLMDSHVGREINCVHYTPDEFRARLRARNHFVMRVLEGPKLYLVGNEEELGRLVTDAAVPADSPPA